MSEDYSGFEDLLDDIDSIDKGLKKKGKAREVIIGNPESKSGATEIYLDELARINEQMDTKSKNQFEFIGHKGDFSEFKRYEESDKKTNRWWKNKKKT